MPRLDGVVDQAGAGGELDGRLGDVVVGIGLQGRGELVLLGLGRVRPHEHAVAAGCADRLDDELVEVGQHVAELRRLAAEEGLDVGQDRVLAQVVADDLRHVGVNRLVVGDAGAGRVADHHIAGPVGVEQAR